MPIKIKHVLFLFLLDSYIVLLIGLVSTATSVPAPLDFSAAMQAYLLVGLGSGSLRRILQRG